MATPVFDGAHEEEIAGLLSSTLPTRDGQQLVGANGKAQLFDGRSGEPYPQPGGGCLVLGKYYLEDARMPSCAF